MEDELMANDFSGRDEMKDLQREAADLAARVGEAASTAGEERSAAVEPEEGRETAKPPAEDRPGEGEVAESEEDVSDLAGQVQRVLQEMGEAAREHPTLALLAVFGLGVVVGQLTSRR